MEDSLKKRYIVKLTASIVSGLLGVIMVAFVPKALGPVSFGQFSYLQQFFTQIIALLDAGTSTAFFTKLSANNSRKELLIFYFSFVIGLVFFLGASLYILDIFDYVHLFLPNISIEHIYLGMFFAFLTWLAQVYIQISDAYALTVSVEMVKIIHKIIMVMLLLYVIHFVKFNLSIYFYYHIFSLLSLILILSILYIKKDIYSKVLLHTKIAYKKLMYEFFSYASHLFIFNVIAIGIILFDIWLLQWIGGSVQTGYYGLAYSIAAICFLFTSALTPLITREFSKSYGENDIKKMRHLFKRYIPMLYAVSAYFAVFISFQSENLLHIFTDEKFKDAYFVLVIMAFYPIHQTYGQLSGSLFLATGETRIYRNIGLFTSLFGLIFSYIFIYVLHWGAVGFAWKMVLIQIIGVNVQLYFNTRFLKINMMSFIIHQIYAVFFFSFFAYLSSFVSLNNALLEFLLSGCIYSLLVGIGIFLFPQIISSNKQEIAKLISIVQRKI
jgi:O-antigen/teichoic acid export membrane protein